MKTRPQEEAFDPSLELDLLNVPEREVYACMLYEYARESKSMLAGAKEIEDWTFQHTSDFSIPSYLLLWRINPSIAVILANLAPKPNL